jgi:hypothetical protein
MEVEAREVAARARGTKDRAGAVEITGAAGSSSRPPPSSWLPRTGGRRSRGTCDSPGRARRRRWRRSRRRRERRGKRRRKMRMAVKGSM